MSQFKLSRVMRSLFFLTLMAFPATAVVTSLNTPVFAAGHEGQAEHAATQAHEMHDAPKAMSAHDAMPAHGEMPAHPGAQHADMFRSLTRAVCVLVSTEGSAVHGTVHFMQTDAGVKVVADVSGLNPGQSHGFHIHEYGDITASDGTSAGGHYNPEGHDHALPNGEPRHAGDLGNLDADETGHAHMEMVVDNLSVAGLVNPIIGRGMIVHAKADDGGQPTGNAGSRVAMGVIGIAAAE